MVARFSHFLEEGQKVLTRLQGELRYKDQKSFVDPSEHRSQVPALDQKIVGIDMVYVYYCLNVGTSPGEKDHGPQLGHQHHLTRTGLYLENWKQH